jgi:DNA-binding MarR family transcriptional regulator
MGKAPRITNRERVLLALADAPTFEDQYELPRRFSQAGLMQRLGMAQSHVSRALNELIEENLLTHRRRRVVGERRRVTAYSLSENGIDKVSDLIDEIESAEVLTHGKEGTLEQVEIRSLVDRWERGGARKVPDALAMAELLRAAESHDGLPLLEHPPEVTVDGGETDLSSEAIGLHLELAELRRSQGDLTAAIDHLGRAAGLHRKRGNSVGEARCQLAAASLGAPLESPSSTIEAVMSIRDDAERLDASLMLFDALLGKSPEEASELIAGLDATNPEVMLRLAEEELRRGGTPSLSEVPEILVGADSLRQALWSANRARLQCRIANHSGLGWPVPLEVEQALGDIGPQSRQPHSLLFGELTIAHVRNPVVSEDERTRLLESAWEFGCPLPTIGHIGFQLAALVSSAEALIILQRLQQRFEAVGDSNGAAVCAGRIERL